MRFNKDFYLKKNEIDFPMKPCTKWFYNVTRVDGIFSQKRFSGHIFFGKYDSLCVYIRDLFRPGEALFGAARESIKSANGKTDAREN